MARPADRTQPSTKLQFLIPVTPESDSDSDIIEVFYVWDERSVPSCNPDNGFTCGAHRANSGCCRATKSRSIDVGEVLNYFKNIAHNKTHLMPCYADINAARSERDRRIQQYNLSTVQIARITLSSKSFVMNTTHLEVLKAIADARASASDICLVKSGLDDTMLFLWGDIDAKNVTDGWDDLALPAPLKEVPEHPLKGPKRVVNATEIFEARLMEVDEWQPDPGLRNYMQRFEENLVGKGKGKKRGESEQA